MRFLRPTLALVLVTLSLGLPGARAEFVLFKNIWGNVIVATDLTPEGRALTPATPEKPVYYLGRTLGAKLGTITGDRLPAEKDMKQLVTQVLAKQGYLGASTGGPEPTLFLVVQWGYMEPDSGELLWFLGYNPSLDIGAPVMPGMIGPEVWRTGFRSRAIETILQDAQGPIYGIIVTAFEYKSARTAQPVIYWQTRIGLPAPGKSMAAALPVMIMAAGPSIGRESELPVLLDADNVREGRVKLGDTKFLETLNEAPREADTGQEK